MITQNRELLDRFYRKISLGFFFEVKDQFVELDSVGDLSLPDSSAAFKKPMTLSNLSSGRAKRNFLALRDSSIFGLK